MIRIQSVYACRETKIIQINTSWSTYFHEFTKMEDPFSDKDFVTAMDADLFGDADSVTGAEEKGKKKRKLETVSAVKSDSMKSTVDVTQGRLYAKTTNVADLLFALEHITDIKNCQTVFFHFSPQGLCITECNSIGSVGAQVFFKADWFEPSYRCPEAFVVPLADKQVEMFRDKVKIWEWLEFTYTTDNNNRLVATGSFRFDVGDNGLSKVTMDELDETFPNFPFESMIATSHIFINANKLIKAVIQTLTKGVTSIKMSIQNQKLSFSAYDGGKEMGETSCNMQQCPADLQFQVWFNVEMFKSVLKVFAKKAKTSSIQLSFDDSLLNMRLTHYFDEVNAQDDQRSYIRTFLMTVDQSMLE